MEVFPTSKLLCYPDLLPGIVAALILDNAIGIPLFLFTCIWTPTGVTAISVLGGTLEWLRFNILTFFCLSVVFIAAIIVGPLLLLPCAQWTDHLGAGLPEQNSLAQGPTGTPLMRGAVDSETESRCTSAELKLLGLTVVQVEEWFVIDSSLTPLDIYCL